jgi:hypothetical protein
LTCLRATTSSERFHGRILLESKEALKKRGISSPDDLVKPVHYTTTNAHTVYKDLIYFILFNSSSHMVCHNHSVIPKVPLEFSFINHELGEDAFAREMEREYNVNEPLIMGVDVARFGTDHTVLAFRQGRSARVIPFAMLVFVQYFLSS